MGNEAHDGGKGISRMRITVGEAAEMLGISRTSAYLCMRSIGREQIPTCFAHDKLRPDRSELTGLRSAEEEPRHRRLEQHERTTPSPCAAPNR